METLLTGLSMAHCSCHSSSSAMKIISSNAIGSGWNALLGLPRSSLSKHIITREDTRSDCAGSASGTEASPTKRGVKGAREVMTVYRDIYRELQLGHT